MNEWNAFVFDRHHKVVLVWLELVNQHNLNRNGGTTVDRDMHRLSNIIHWTNKLSLILTQCFTATWWLVRFWILKGWILDNRWKESEKTMLDNREKEKQGEKHWKMNKLKSSRLYALWINGELKLQRVRWKSEWITRSSLKEERKTI